VISTLELRRIFVEWKTRLQRVQAILSPQNLDETDWKKFGRALVGLVQRHGATWTNEPTTYWDLRWNLRDGGQLICQAESIPGQKISLVVAQTGGFVQEVDSYTWFWVEFNPEGEFIRDPYWVDGNWREALLTLLMPYQYAGGLYLTGTAATPPALLLGTSTPVTHEPEVQIASNEESVETPFFADRVVEEATVQQA
jgi:hypothetical protein